MTRYQRHVVSAVLWATIGLTLVGWGLGDRIGSNPEAVVTTLTRAGSTRIIPTTRTLTVERVVRGKVRRFDDTRFVYVPRVVVHIRNCHRTPGHQCARRVVVPAHRIRLHKATIHQLVATAAVMPVTVTVYLPTTIYSMVTSPPATETLPQATTTVFVPTTVTVTLPLEP